MYSQRICIHWTGLPPAVPQSSGVKLKASYPARCVGALVKTRNSKLQQPGSFSNDLFPDKCQWPHIHLQKALTRDASLTLEAGFGHCEGVKRHLSQICQYAASQSPPPPWLQMPRHCHYLPWWAGATCSSWARAVISIPLTLCESHQLISECPPWRLHLTVGWLTGFGERERIRKADKENKDRGWWRTHANSQRQPRGERTGC